jgi:hypothetical protein
MTASAAGVLLSLNVRRRGGGPLEWHSDGEFWSLVMREGLPRFRWARRPLRLAAIDEVLGGHPDWPALRARVAAGDAVWPFRLPRSRRAWGHREGFVVLRRGRLLGGIVTVAG